MLNGRFIYKSTPGGTFNKSKFICSLCMAQFHYHQRINYCLHAKQHTNNEKATSELPQARIKKICAHTVKHLKQQFCFKYKLTYYILYLIFSFIKQDKIS